MNRFRILKQDLRHLSRVLRGKPDPAWPFFRFERAVHPETWKRHDGYLSWAERCETDSATLEAPERYAYSDDPVVRQGYDLACRVRNDFRDKYRGATGLRVLIHVPPSDVSPGGHSLFANLLASLAYIGIPAQALTWGMPIEQCFQQFGPTVLLSSDHESYLQRIDWDTVKKHQRKGPLRVGLTASPAEQGNTPLKERLAWAARHAVSFYYGFHAAEHLRSDPSYLPYHERGYRICSVKFGANPLLYYPVPGMNRDIDYVFLASSNQDKWDRYFRFLPPVCDRYAGIIDGPGWTNLDRWARPSVHRFLYARAKVGLNLHIPDSIELPSELNERTYILAACGVPQLIDDPLLLKERFTDDCFFVARNEKEYQELFLQMLNEQGLAQKKALQAQEQVFRSHTTFHRAEQVVRFLSEMQFSGVRDAVKE